MAWRRCSIGEASRPFDPVICEWDGGGDGPGCLLVHGFADNICIWNEIAASLAPHFRVFGVDLPGHGGSDLPPGSSGLDLADIAHRIVRLAIHLTGDPLALVGHSIGAEVAIRAAALLPGKLWALVIADFGDETIPAGVDRVREMTRKGPRQFVDAGAFANWLKTQMPFASGPALENYARAVAGTCPDGAIGPQLDPRLLSWSRFSSGDLIDGRYQDPALRARLRDLTCPTLVLRGAASAVLAQDTAVRMTTQTLAQGELTVIPRAGHALMLDNASAMASALRGFLLRRSVACRAFAQLS